MIKNLGLIVFLLIFSGKTHAQFKQAVTITDYIKAADSQKYINSRQAIQYLTIADSIFPNSTKINFTIGQYLFDYGFIKESLDYFNKSKINGKDDGELNQYMGMAFLKLNKSKIAINYFNKALLDTNFTGFDVNMYIRWSNNSLSINKNSDIDLKNMGEVINSSKNEVSVLPYYNNNNFIFKSVDYNTNKKYYSKFNADKNTTTDLEIDLFNQNYYIISNFDDEKFGVTTPQKDEMNPNLFQVIKLDINEKANITNLSEVIEQKFYKKIVKKFTNGNIVYVDCDKNLSRCIIEIEFVNKKVDSISKYEVDVYYNKSMEYSKATIYTKNYNYTYSSKYYIYKQEDGSLISLPEVLNSEYKPKISTNGNYLFLALKKLDSYGGNDIYKFDLNNWLNNSTIDLMHLPFPINTSAEEFNYIENNKKAYFSSDRIGGFGGFDIWYYDLPKE